MNWELDRHDWAEFGEDGSRLRRAIQELVTTGSPDRAKDLRFLVESIAVPVDGPLQPTVAAAAACLVQGLLSATPAARVEILFLLYQCAGGVVAGPQSDLTGALRREVEFGLPLYAEIAETGTRDERLQCIELLSLCARLSPYSRARAGFILRRIGVVGNDEAALVRVELEDLERDGSAE